MGGKGSGRRGARRNPKGQMMKEADLTFTVVAEADGATASIENLDSAIDDLSMSLQGLDNNFQATGDNMNTYTTTTGDATKASEDFEMQQMMVMAKLTMVVSGLNQLTGSLYKTIGGLEATGLIGEDTARVWQEQARAVELLTGPLEFLISLEILAAAAGKPFLATLWAKVPSYAAVTASASAAAVATWAFLSPILLVIAAVVAIVAVFALLYYAWKRQAEIIAAVKDGAESLLNIFKSIIGVGGAVKGTIGGIGDALTDNPLGKSLLKAGAMF